MAKEEHCIEIKQLCTSFGEHIVHDHLDLSIRKGEILAIVGGSGTGKSTLLREMILLQQPNSGTVNIFGQDIHNLSDKEAQKLRMRWGVMFQQGGLFGTLTVLDNIALPLREHTQVDEATIKEIARWKLSLAGLQPEAGAKYPSELSGGMIKRAALARSIALDPELLFLDEPTAGLDPKGGDGIDVLIKTLHSLYQPTIVIITHDLDMLWQVTDRVAVLGEKKVLAVASMNELAKMDHPIIRDYFDGSRGRAAQEQAMTLHQNRPAPGKEQETSWKQK